MSSDSNGYGGLSSINWNTYKWPPPYVAKVTETVALTRSFPPLTQIMPGSADGTRMPSAGTRYEDTPANPQSFMPGQQGMRS